MLAWYARWKDTYKVSNSKHGEQFLGLLLYPRENRSFFCCTVVYDGLNRIEVWSSDMSKHVLIWYNSKQRSPIHHIFSMGYVNKLANTFTNLSRIPCLYAWVWLEPQIQRMAIQKLSQPSVLEAELLSDVKWSRFPRSVVWWVTILYQMNDFANTWEVSSIHPIDAHSHIGLYHGIEDPQFQAQLANDEHSSYKANEPKANFGWNWQDQSDLGQDKKVFGLMFQLFVQWNNVGIFWLTLSR